MIKPIINEDLSYSFEYVELDRKSIDGTASLADLIFKKIKERGVEREHFVAVFMDRGFKPICLGVLFSGKWDGAEVQPSVVVSHALRVGASLVAIGHNHPNGTCLPSMDDMEATDRIQEELRKFGLQLTNSLVIPSSHREGVEDFLDCIEIGDKVEAFRAELMKRPPGA